MPKPNSYHEDTATCANCAHSMHLNDYGGEWWMCGGEAVKGYGICDEWEEAE